MNRYAEYGDNPNFVNTFKGLGQEVSRLMHVYWTLRSTNKEIFTSSAGKSNRLGYRFINWKRLRLRKKEM